MIAFIDESKATRYLFALCLLEPRYLAGTRKILVQNLLAGQRSIHFRKESNRRRTQLIRKFLKLDIRIVVFIEKRAPSVNSRNLLIRQICEQSRHFKITELVIELDQSSFNDDVKHLNEIRPAFIWDYRERHQEPILWVADAVAWCVNRGGEWERMVRPMIIETFEC